MPNIASVLKNEISRVARKEARAETGQLKKASSNYRADIAALKRRIAALEQVVSRLAKAGNKKVAEAVTEEAAGSFRFSARRLAAQRKRLGLSAAEAGLLLGASGQSVYKWESGKARPRASQFPAIAAFRRLSKAEASTQLSELAK